jgi:hypothetical protein
MGMAIIFILIWGMGSRTCIVALLQLPPPVGLMSRTVESGMKEDIDLIRDWADITEGEMRKLTEWIIMAMVGMVITRIETTMTIGVKNLTAESEIARRTTKKMTMGATQQPVLGDMQTTVGMLTVHLTDEHTMIDIVAAIVPIPETATKMVVMDAATVLLYTGDRKILSDHVLVIHLMTAAMMG